MYCAFILKKQTNPEFCVINMVLIDCFLFFQQDVEKQLFRPPILRSWYSAGKMPLPGQSP